MAANVTTSTDATAEVMASVDSSGDEDLLVIADVSRDDAYLAVPLAGASSLPECR